MLHPQVSFLNVHVLQYSDKEASHMNIHAVSEFKQTKTWLMGDARRF